ncbi:hypothetical protein AAMO2058_000445000 [Amorphochlora amoebiformis]
METYHIHETAPVKKTGNLRALRRNWLVLASGAVMACAVVMLFNAVWFPSSSDAALNGSDGARSPATRTYDRYLGSGLARGLRSGASTQRAPMTHRVALHPSPSVLAGSRIHSQGLTRDRKVRDVQANYRRRYDPFDPFGLFGGMDPFFGKGVRITNQPGSVGKMANDIFDIMDELVGISDAAQKKYQQVTPDMEEYLLERQKIRQEYEDRMESLRQKQLDKIQGQAEAESQTDRVQRTRRPAEVEINQRPTKRDIPVINAGASSTANEMELTKKQAWAVPSLSAEETDNSYSYTLDIEGMDQENLKLNLQGNMVIVEGMKMVETDNGYHSSAFKRSFSLPANADLDTVKSEDKGKGKLVLTVLKKVIDPKQAGGETGGHGSNVAPQA